jgi:hypothetical protein
MQIDMISYWRAHIWILMLDWIHVFFLLFITQITEFVVSKMMHFTSISFFNNKKIFLFEWPCFSYTCGVFLCIESKHQNIIPTKLSISWPLCFHMGANKIIWAIPITLMNVYFRIFSNVLNFLLCWIQVIRYYSNNKIKCLKSKPCSWNCVFNTRYLLNVPYLCYCWKNWKLACAHTHTHIAA